MKGRTEFMLKRSHRTILIRHWNSNDVKCEQVEKATKVEAIKQGGFGIKTKSCRKPINSDVWIAKLINMTMWLCDYVITTEILFLLRCTCLVTMPFSAVDDLITSRHRQCFVRKVSYLFYVSWFNILRSLRPEGNLNHTCCLTNTVTLSILSGTSAT